MKCSSVTFLRCITLFFPVYSRNISETFLKILKNNSSLWRGILHHFITEIFHEMFIFNILAINLFIFSWNIFRIFLKRFLEYSKINFVSGKEHCGKITVIFHEMFYCNIGKASLDHYSECCRNIYKTYLNILNNNSLIRRGILFHYYWNIPWNVSL